MLRGIRVVAGAARSGKTQLLLDRYRSVLAEAPGTALWLAPTHRAAVAVRQRILDAELPGCINPHCLTFGQFSRRVLDASPLRVRPISLLVERQIFRTLIEEARRANQLVHFAPIADTPGFLDVLVGFVRELKRLEIWPHELQAAAGTRRSQKDRELCHLYHEYQRVLTTHHLYDAEGRFWSARARLLDGQTRPFERVRHVFVAGFTDFTRTEHEILDILADRVQSLSIGLPLETGEARADLFAKSAKTLAELRRRHTGLTVEELPARPGSWPAMDHLERFLFAGPGRVAAPPEAEGMEVVAAAGVTGEVEQLARRIKTLLVKGDPHAPSPSIGEGDAVLTPTPLMGEGRGEGGCSEAW